MQPDAEQSLEQLATLIQPIAKHYWFSLPYHEHRSTFDTYRWDASVSGKFSSLQLLRAEDWIKPHDFRLSEAEWQWSEITGLASTGVMTGGEFGYGDIYEEDPKGIFLTKQERSDRSKTYSELFHYIRNELENVSSYLIRCHHGYALSIIVGRLSDGRWLCLSPSVIRETPHISSPEGQGLAYSKVEEEEAERLSSSDESRIYQSLKRLKPISVYGWYNRVHSYRIEHAIAGTKKTATEKILLSAKLIERYKFHQFNAQDMCHDYDETELREPIRRFQALNQFLDSSFEEVFVYRVSLWDHEHLFFLDPSQEPDKVGFVFRSQFTYNP